MTCGVVCVVVVVWGKWPSFDMLERFCFAWLMQRLLFVDWRRCPHWVIMTMFIDVRHLGPIVGGMILLCLHVCCHTFIQSFRAFRWAGKREEEREGEGRGKSMKSLWCHFLA